MKPRISASKRIINKLNQKINHAKQIGNVAMLRKTQVILCIISDFTYEDIAKIVSVSVETIRLLVTAFLLKGFACFDSKKSPGRPPKLTKTQKKELKKTIKKGPETAGYQSGCWNSALIQNYIYENFGIYFSVFYIAELLKNLGFSYQKARFASAHLDPTKRQEWLDTKWPEILKLSKKKKIISFLW